ncbi:MAG: glycosyl transferase family 2, partial [Pseudolabrys sp.]|nr:glycosyl transferase family 2 [Pseudolabrys sp.]
GRGHIEVISTQGPPSGWTGKLWAVRTGVVAAEKSDPDFLLLTDADIVHAPDTVRSLVARALDGNLVLTSLMAKLRCESRAERMHVPAFIHFFQMLFPFAWVNDPTSRTAAAAGGCMLVKAEGLRRCGGIDSIRNALIDDCSLAEKLKTVGPIWLGLTERSRSIRPYLGFSDVRKMISRSAYAQLRYSPWLLAMTTLAMLIVFVAPPLIALFGTGSARWLGLVTWLTMAVTYLPILRFYRLSLLWGPLLPVVALLFTIYTLDSAYRHYRRRGGEWKGRVHAGAPSLP